MKKVFTPEMKTEGLGKEKELSLFEKTSEKLSSIHEALHDALVMLSGNPVEKDPLVIQDNQGRERVATMRKNANQVSKKLKQGMALLAAMGALSALGAASGHVDEAARPSASDSAHVVGKEGPSDFALDLTAFMMDEFSNLENKMKEFQKELDARTQKGTEHE